MGGPHQVAVSLSRLPGIIQLYGAHSIRTGTWRDRASDLRMVSLAQSPCSHLPTPKAHPAWIGQALRQHQGHRVRPAPWQSMSSLAPSCTAPPGPHAGPSDPARHRPAGSQTHAASRYQSPRAGSHAGAWSHAAPKRVQDTGMYIRMAP